MIHEHKRLMHILGWFSFTIDLRWRAYYVGVKFLDAHDPTAEAWFYAVYFAHPWRGLWRTHKIARQIPKTQRNVTHNRIG